MPNETGRSAGIASQNRTTIVDDGPPTPRIADTAASSAASSAAYAVPDFKADMEARTTYHEDVREFIATAIRNEIRTSEATYSKKLDELHGNQVIATAQHRDAFAACKVAMAAYATLLPHRRFKSGDLPGPSLWEWILTFGRAGALFGKARAAYMAQLRAETKLRNVKLEIERKDRSFQKALQERENEIRRSYKSDAGLAKVHHEPRIRRLHDRVLAIDKEREDFQRRLDAGMVSDAEQRDRLMSQDDIAFLFGYVYGLSVVGHMTFGKLTYKMLECFDGLIWFVEDDSALASITPRMRFDVIHHAQNSYSVARTEAVSIAAAKGAQGFAREKKRHARPHPRDGAGTEPGLRESLRAFATAS